MKTTDIVTKPGPSYSGELSPFPELVMVTALSKCSCILSQLAEKGELYGPRMVPFQESRGQFTVTATSYSSGQPSRYFDSVEKDIMKKVKEKEKEIEHVPIVKERRMIDKVS